MERHNKPPPLSIPNGSPYLSALPYRRTPSAHSVPTWSTTRRYNRRKFLVFTNATARIFGTVLFVTALLTWILIRPSQNTTSPLSQLPERVIPNHPPHIPPFENIDSIRQDELPEKANSTLNFQQIFAINLPSRLDRKDLLTVMAIHHNLSITIVPGVRSVAENALPPPRRPGTLRPEEYAVWRAHANVWRRIIDEGLTTALIMEDDNDWDLNIREQIPRILNALEEIRQPSTKLEDEAVVRGGPEIEPWDILYLGSCWEAPTLTDRFDRRLMVPIPSDQENVVWHNFDWVEAILVAHGQNNPATRLLQRSSMAQCTHSYAVTALGARKLLYYTSMNLDKRLDMALVDLVRQNLVNAFTVVPPVMVQWRTTERAGKDTDVGYDVWPVHNWGFTHSTRYFLRKKDNEDKVYDPNPPKPDSLQQNQVPQDQEQEDDVPQEHEE